MQSMINHWNIFVQSSILFFFFLKKVESGKRNIRKGICRGMYIFMCKYEYLPVYKFENICIFGLLLTLNRFQSYFYQPSQESNICIRIYEISYCSNNQVSFLFFYSFPKIKLLPSQFDKLELGSRLLRLKQFNLFKT